MVDILEKAQLKLEQQKQKDVSHPPVAPKIIKPAMGKLHPPKAPKPMEKQEISKELEDQIREFLNTEFAKLVQENTKPLNIDYDKVSQRSDMIRERYLLVTGKTWRGTDANCKKALSKLHVVEHPDFANVIKNLKENFLNGFTKPSQIK